VLPAASVVRDAQEPRAPVAPVVAAPVLEAPAPHAATSTTVRTEPTPEAPQRSRVGTWIALSLALVVLVGISAWALAHTGDATPPEQQDPAATLTNLQPATHEPPQQHATPDERVVPAGPTPPAPPVPTDPRSPRPPRGHGGHHDDIDRTNPYAN